MTKRGLFGYKNQKKQEQQIWEGKMMNYVYLLGNGISSPTTSLINSSSSTRFLLNLG